MTIRYGLVGAGMMGQEHISNIKLLPDTEIAAIVEPDPAMRQRAMEMAGTAIPYDQLSDLLSAGTCDAFVIAAPNDLHHDLLLQLLPANKPVLVEKPLCTTVDQCKRVIAAARTAAPVWVAMEYRYMLPLVRLRETLDQGIAGDPVMLSIREHRFPFLPKVGDWNRFNRRTGGTMIEKCCHFWDLMRLLLNSEPVRVFASAGVDVNHLDERYDGRTPDIIDNGFVVIDFANGTRGMLDLCMFAEGGNWQEIVAVTGPKAEITARIPGPARFAAPGAPNIGEIEVAHRGAGQVDVEALPVPDHILHAGDHYGSTYFQHLEFLQLVRGERARPQVTLRDGLWSVMVGEAAGESARTGQAVEITAP